MKKVKIVSQTGLGSDTKVFVDGLDVTREMRLKRVLIESGETNRAWLQVTLPELDIEAEIDDGEPPADRLLSLERKIERGLDDVIRRLVEIEDAIRS